jgi:hypothetical protein
VWTGSTLCCSRQPSRCCIGLGIACSIVQHPCPCVATWHAAECPSYLLPALRCMPHQSSERKGPQVFTLQFGLLSQEHQRRERGALSRPAFLQIAAEDHCQLYFPQHGDQVVLLRSGLQVHLKRYMQSLGLVAPDEPPSPSPQPKESSPPPQGTPSQEPSPPLHASGAPADLDIRSLLYTAPCDLAHPAVDSCA